MGSLLFFPQFLELIQTQFFLCRPGVPPHPSRSAEFRSKPSPPFWGRVRGGGAALGIDSLACTNIEIGTTLYMGSIMYLQGTPIICIPVLSLVGITIAFYNEKESIIAPGAGVRNNAFNNDFKVKEDIYLGP